MNAALETAIRLGCFAGVFASLALAERFIPRRPLIARQAPRWTSNLLLVFLNVIATRIALPVTALQVAAVASERGWGLLPQWSAPHWARFFIAVVALDFAIYLQHVLFHAVPVFWRLHLVHHADLDLDVTTGLRFHTLEILLSALIKIGAVLALGSPVLAVLTFEVLLNTTSMFNHSNLRLPGSLDRILRLFVVTPDMHRVHHSVDPRETNSNFGFNLPWWDRLLGTYRPEPAAGHDAMQIGLSHLRDEAQVERLPKMLALPFVRGVTSASSTRMNEETADYADER